PHISLETSFAPVTAPGSFLAWQSSQRAPSEWLNVSISGFIVRSPTATSSGRFCGSSPIAASGPSCVVVVRTGGGGASGESAGPGEWQATHTTRTPQSRSAKLIYQRPSRSEQRPLCDPRAEHQSAGAEPRRYRGVT